MTPAPTKKLIPTATVTPSSTLTPTSHPCTDTDGGKDYFTKGTLTTSYGDTYTDFCSDPNIVSEYYCPAGASFASDGYICPGLCLDGACLPVPTATVTPATAEPTKKLLPTPTSTTTPTPTNVPCLDTDGGKDIYTNGSVTTWGKTHFDTCYSLQGVGYLDQCSGPFCRLLEFSCQPQGYQGEPFTCQYGCLNGACIKTPSPTPTSTPTLTPIPTTTSTPTPIPTNIPPTATLTPTPTLSPDRYELTFTYVGDIKAIYEDKTGKNLNDDVQKIYKEIREIFGAPRAPITVAIKYGQSGGASMYSYYNVSTNEIVLSDYEFNTLYMAKKIILAFHDDILVYMPYNWELAMWNLVITEVTDKLGQGLAGQNACIFCELYGVSPVWATNGGTSWTPNNGSTFANLAINTIGKFYVEDSYFFVKFNQALYRLPVNIELGNRLAAVAAGIKSTVEGIPFNDWFSTQYILQLKAIPGKYIIPLLYIDYGKETVNLAVSLIEVHQNGDKEAVGGKLVKITAFDQDNSQIWNKEANTDSQGLVGFGHLPDYSTDISAVRFQISTPNFDPYVFSYPYWGNKPILPGFEMSEGSNTTPGLFGVINRETGSMKYTYRDYTKDKGNPEGRLLFQQGWLKGTTGITYMKDGNDPGTTKSVSKMEGDYYVNFQLAQAASSSTRGGSPQFSPTASPAADFVCDTEDWHNYYSDNFEFEAQYPPGWNTQTGDTYDTINQTRLSLVSTTDSASLLDQALPHSFFDVIASTNDLKTDSDYGRWFDDNTGNQTVSETEILGQSAEKYLDETDMPAGSHRNIMYYFKEGSDYFLISLSYYISPDLKAENERIADCFLNTIKLMEPEPTPEGGIYQCAQGRYTSFEEIAKLSGQDDPTERCQSEPKEIVCGKIRSVFDNQERADSWQEFNNECSYCAYFDQSGQRKLRGTTMYALGYKKGPCADQD